MALCKNNSDDVRIWIDCSDSTGVLSKINNQYDLDSLKSSINFLNHKNNYCVSLCNFKDDSTKELNYTQFGSHLVESHCFRGYPICGSFKQFVDTNEKYLLHLDCDMIFYEENGYSWIQEGIRIMEENEDILCVLPKGGPPRQDGSLNQGSTPYKVDKERGLYLFKNFTSRHYLIHRERFLSLLPLEAVWLSWREPIKSKLFGNGKLLCWETIVEKAMEKSSFWRADLMTDKAWSLHPADRSEQFYNLLPEILDCVSRNEFPDEQKGFYDLLVNQWANFINNKN